MNYGTYTEYKIKNRVFENFDFLKILQNIQKYKNYELWNV